MSDSNTCGHVPIYQSVTGVDYCLDCYLTHCHQCHAYVGEENNNVCDECETANFEAANPCKEHSDCRGEGYTEHIDACLKAMKSKELYDEINKCCGTGVSECESCPCAAMWRELNTHERTVMPNGARRMWFLQTKVADFGFNPLKNQNIVLNNTRGINFDLPESVTNFLMSDDAQGFEENEKEKE